MKECASVSQGLGLGEAAQPLVLGVPACQGGRSGLSHGASGLAELAFVSSSAARWPGVG